MRIHCYCGCLVMVVCCWQTLSAQMPSLKTRGDSPDAVYLQKLSVDVVVDGAIATTTWTMTFKNPSRRILEGELNFPLPPDVPVSKYALDINGVLREAVPVEKAKGTEVFENTERRRIDPGLLEKVDGNTFRTRIYPIPPEGVRTVRIGYEQELSWEGESELRYRLPLAFTRPIEEFVLHISVPGASKRPVVDANTEETLSFEEWKEVWSVTHKWNNYLADKPIAIRIPQTRGAGALLMEQQGSHYYYTASVFPKPEQIAKPAPHRITLLWDVSLSALQSDRKKELEFLDNYFGQSGNVEVRLVPFSNAVDKVTTFSIHNGDWQSLKKTLQDLVYDGGTQFGQLHLNDYPCDEFLLFSDGHSTFGSDAIGLSDRPVYAITATVGADYPFLESITGRTGGILIQLNDMPVKKAADLLRYQPLQFLGVKHSADLAESYPSQPTTITGGLTVAGSCDLPAKEIVLQFGYGNKVVREEKLTLDYPRQQTAGVARIWAEKKIAELDMRYNDNQEEIRHLGRRYGIVTRNTSLIVLENVMDYVNNGIEPPADLREAYDRILKGREQNLRQQEARVTDRASAYFNELLQWWRGEAVRIDTTTYSVADVSLGLEGRASGVAVGSSRAVLAYGYATQRRSEPMRKVKDDAEAAGPSPAGGYFTLLKADVNTAYLKELKAAAPEKRYAVYLQLRKDYQTTPLFYFHTAELFFGAGDKIPGLRILSNIAELDAENFELYKLMGYKLREAGAAEAACATFRKVLEWRPLEPQSYRDYGLALEDAGHYQRALDTLYLALTKNYDASTEALYPGIEETLLPEINDLVALHAAELNTSAVPKKLLTNMPVDMRVVLNWNQPNTDIDLWVTDPDNERCFYGHRFTAMGGRISHDFTRGLGPEQFLLKKAVKGTYKVEVNYYGDTQMKLAGETTLLVEVYTHYGTPQQKRNLVTMQLKPGSSGASYVGEFEF